MALPQHHLKEPTPAPEPRPQPVPGSALRQLERHRGKLILGALALSLLFHLGSLIELHQPDRSAQSLRIPQRPPVKVTIVPKAKAPKKQEKTPSPDQLPNILETPQAKTDKPVAPSYAGVVDHKALKEMRLKDRLNQERAKDPGQKGKPDAKPAQVAKDAKTAPPPKEAPTPAVKPTAKPAKPETLVKSPKKSDIKIQDTRGTLAVSSAKTPKPRNQYEALLPSSNELPGQLNAGYQEYVDDKIQEGDRIDINTSEYRYIGYFTNMRKAIELVWNYPTEASRRGLQGEVLLEFAIGKDGKTSHIRVLKSSGYEVLDRAIIEAIKLASPFSPLPDGFGKQRIVVTGSFRYILSAYGAH